MHWDSLVALAAAASLTACGVGGWHSGYRDSPLGNEVEVRYPRVTIRDGREYHGGEERLDGELLIVRDGDVVVLFEGRAMLVPLTEVNSLSFPGSPVEDWPPNKLSAEEHQEQMRLVSRYPFGLTDEQLESLLTSLGQSELDSLR